jgi:hypothetical protein
VAMSTALRLLNFTFECLLDPLVRGDGSGLTARDRRAGWLGLREHTLSGSCHDPVGQVRRADPRQPPESSPRPSSFCDLGSGMLTDRRNILAMTRT